MARLLLALLILALLILALAAPASAQAFRSDRIAVTARGAGPDVILIPGLASTPAVWDATVRALDDRYRVHVVAVNGFGDTAPGANARGPLTVAIADELRRYAAEQGLERPAVIGHSLGGQIALRMAADAPGRVGRVMVVDSSPFFPSLIYEVMTTDLRADLARVTAPVTVVYGWSESVDSPRHQVDQGFRQGFLRLRNAARFERIEGAQHMVMIDRPQAFLASVNRFLTR